MKSWFVTDDSLSAVEGGLQLDVRLPWYRSLPLSALDFGPIAIDGQPIDAGAIMVTLNGSERPMADLTGLRSRRGSTATRRPSAPREPRTRTSARCS